VHIAAKLRNARTSLSHRRTTRLAHRQLSDELATFTSAADRVELDSILDRHSSEETRQIRAILIQQDAERRFAANVGGHRA
jgi:hypothetical protein